MPRRKLYSLQIQVGYQPNQGKVGAKMAYPAGLRHEASGGAKSWVSRRREVSFCTMLSGILEQGSCSLNSPWEIFTSSSTRRFAKGFLIPASSEHKKFSIVFFFVSFKSCRMIRLSTDFGWNLTSFGILHICSLLRYYAFVYVRWTLYLELHHRCFQSGDKTQAFMRYCEIGGKLLPHECLYLSLDKCIEPWVDLRKCRFMTLLACSSKLIHESHNEVVQPTVVIEI